MMMLQPDQPEWMARRPDDVEDASGSRLNLLLSCGSWRDHTAVDQLPRLLDPMGIHSIRVESGEEAAQVIQVAAIHIAVVDLSIPFRRAAADPVACGHRILQLLRHLDEPPPTVVVRPSSPSKRDRDRSLSRALREGAFAVLDRPVELESMLEVLRRILTRHFSDTWPT